MIKLRGSVKQKTLKQLQEVETVVQEVYDTYAAINARFLMEQLTGKFRCQLCKNKPVHALIEKQTLSEKHKYFVRKLRNSYDCERFAGSIGMKIPKDWNAYWDFRPQLNENCSDTEILTIVKKINALGQKLPETIRDFPVYFAADLEMLVTVVNIMKKLDGLWVDLTEGIRDEFKLEAFDMSEATEQDVSEQKRALDDMIESWLEADKKFENVEIRSVGLMTIFTSMPQSDDDNEIVVVGQVNIKTLEIKTVTTTKTEMYRKILGEQNGRN